MSKRRGGQTRLCEMGVWPGLRAGVRRFLPAFALSALLVGAQIVALHHNTEFGGDAHSHNGAACEIAVLAKGLTGLAENAPALPVPFTRYIARAPLAQDQNPGYQPVDSGRIRAPPRTLS